MVLYDKAMPLTADQQKRIKQALRTYKQKVRSIVGEHRQKVLTIAAQLDQQKSEKLRNRIQKA